MENPVASIFLTSLKSLDFVKTFLPILLTGIVFIVLEEFLPEKNTKFFLKKYRIDFFTLLFAIIGYLASYIFLKSPDFSLLVNILITFIATIVLIYSKTKEKEFYFIALKSNSDKEDWLGEGTFQHDRVHGAYSITNSGSGFIFSKCLNWSDYSLDFEFKILNKSLGVILRATNLSNLLMMQIFEDGIKAHIRINGFWQAWTPAQSGLVFNKKLNLDKWFKCRIQCDKSSIRIRITNKEGHQIFDRVWKIPAGEVNYLLPVKQDPVTQSVTVPFPINLEYGTVGFRNDGQEKAVVKDMLIEKLQGAENAE